MEEGPTRHWLDAHKDEDVSHDRPNTLHAQSMWVMERTTRTRARTQVETMLLNACAEGEADAVRWLLDARSGDLLQLELHRAVSTPNSRGRVPLDVACAHGHLAVCEALLECGAAAASVNHRNCHDTMTPLHRACGGGYLPVVELLLEHGAEESLTLTAGYPWDGTPVAHAFRGKHFHVCDYLLRRVAGDWSKLCAGGQSTASTGEGRNRNGPEPLVCAAQIPPVVHELWHIACARKSVEWCDWLWRQGGGVKSGVQRRDEYGRSLLWSACVGYNYVVAEWLLAKGARRPAARPADMLHLHNGAMAWVVAHCRSHLEPTEIAHMFRVASTRERRLPSPELLCTLLRLGGADVVDCPIPPSLLLYQAYDTVVETAVRVGVALEYLECHPRLASVLERLVQERQAFVRGFLFACRRSSGSSQAWRIGARHALAGFRREVAAFAGVMTNPAQWARVAMMWAKVVTARARGGSHVPLTITAAPGEGGSRIGGEEALPLLLTAFDADLLLYGPTGNSRGLW